MFRLRDLLFLIVPCCLAVIEMSRLGADDLPEGVIWVEGEEAVTKEVSANGWYDSVKSNALSGGQWLSHFDKRKGGTASFRVTVPTSGDYAFWLRANPLRTKLSFRFDNAGQWNDVSFAETRGQANIARDNKPDLRFIAWTRVGSFKLAQGEHAVEFRFRSQAQNHGAIDCFVLTNKPFIPSGTTKPSSDSADAKPEDWFAVMMDIDPLSEESVIDMSQLIESPAGKLGFLQRDGDALKFSNANRPTKFWGVGAGPQGRSTEQMEQAAAWFRKHGINIVRQHTVIGEVGLLNEDGEFDAQKLDRYDRWFASLKKHGIYSTWSVVYPHHGAFLRSEDLNPELFKELDESDSEHNGLDRPIVANDYINLDRSIQAVAWRYFEKLLNHVNPHTGLAYKDDPALAFVEVQNESNVFFYTLNSLLDSIKVPHLSRSMRKRFFQFAKTKYGNQANAEKAWGTSRPQDDWQRGELALMGAHHWGSDGPKFEYQGQDRRCGDYIEFLSSIQRGYYQRRVQQLRDIGFRGVTVTTAWKSGGPGASLANLYCDTAADCIDRHNYFGGGEGGHRITEGNVNVATHLENPGSGILAVGMFQLDNRPFAVSEWSHLPPSPWKAEAAPLVAFYGLGLQGWDASYHFNMGDRRIGDGWPNQTKYASQTPHYIGQFPALAFAIHQGHIEEGNVVARRTVTKQDVFAGRDVLGQSLAGGGYDAKELTGSLTTSPLALAAGRVTIQFAQQDATRQDATRQDATQSSKLDGLHNTATRTVQSSTGQLVWRYGDRVVEVRSSKTQGIIGFTGGNRTELPDAVVQTDTPFVSLLFTPLDDAELKSSKHILVTAMARDKQTGSTFNEDWSQLLAEGRPPLLMEPVQATIELSGARPKSVRPLDLYGVPKGNEIKLASDGSFRIDGTSRTYYYEVRR